MVVLTSAWPSSDCTVRMSVPACSRWVANEWRSVCTVAGLAMPTASTAALRSRCRRFSWMWWRCSASLRGSLLMASAGKTQNQAQLSAARLYLAARACGR